MAQDKNRLIWIDLEMTGLIPETDRIIEIGIVITDSHLDNLLMSNPYKRIRRLFSYLLWNGPIMVGFLPEDILIFR